MRNVERKHTSKLNPSMKMCYKGEVGNQGLCAVMRAARIVNFPQEIHQYV